LHVIGMNSRPRTSVLLVSPTLILPVSGISTLHWVEKGSPCTIKLLVYDNDLGVLSLE
jgi:hypothetical protein